MAIMQIGGANPIDLLDKTAFAGFTVQDDSINRQVDYSPTGCFGSAGRSAVLRKAKTLGWTRRYTLYATGAGMDYAIANMEQLRTELIAAEKFNMQMTDTSDGIIPHEAWVVRSVQDQSFPSVWTILFGSVSEVQSFMLSLDEIRVCGSVEVFLMRGAQHVGLNGFPYQA